MYSKQINPAKERFIKRAKENLSNPGKYLTMLSSEQISALKRIVEDAERGGDGTDMDWMILRSGE